MDMIIEFFLAEAKSKHTEATGLMLKEYRARNNLNTNDVAIILSVSNRTIERIESGKQPLKNKDWLYLQLIANELPFMKVLKIGG